jgi:hypothetical protein
VTSNGLAEIITGPDTGGGPHVQTFFAGGLPLGGGFFAYHSTFTGGVRVASGNLDAAGTDEIVTGAGRQAAPHVLGLTGAGALSGTSFFAY